MSSAQKSAQNPQVLEMLEHLDDAVFEAISGSTTALARLEVLWPTVLSELGPELVQESREEYLRYALSVWNNCPIGEDRQSQRAIAALDVLCLLFEEAGGDF